MTVESAFLEFAQKTGNTTEILAVLVHKRSLNFNLLLGTVIIKALGGVHIIHRKVQGENTHLMRTVLTAVLSQSELIWKATLVHIDDTYINED